MRYPARSTSLLRLSLSLSLSLSLAVGCDGCPSDRPYTPYTLGSSAPSPSGSPALSASPAPSGSEAARGEPAPAAPDAGAGGRGGDAGEADGGAGRAVGTPPPQGGKRWPLGDAERGPVAEAPPGRSFETGLMLDGDGDGARDLLAWARAPDGLRGELLFVPGARPDAGRTVAAMPGGIAGAGCPASAALAQLSRGTVALEIAPRCPAAPRWLAVVRVGGGEQAAPQLALELRVRAPGPEESLAMEPEAADRDGDGREDLAIRFTLGVAGADGGVADGGVADGGVADGGRGSAPAGPSATAAAPLWFLDRPAGLSRDAAQPAAALKALAEELLADAAKPGARASVAGRARAIRRLHAFLCGEAGGAASVTLGDGPARCGELSLEPTLARAEARAGGAAR